MQFQTFAFASLITLDCKEKMNFYFFILFFLNFFKIFFNIFNAILVCLHSFYVCMYVCMAVLGLRFCARVFSSCGKRGPLFIAVCGPLTITASRCRAQAPDAQAQ